MILLKLTIPLVDYDAVNHNWNKVTTIVNCLTAPVFMAFATKSKNFTLIQNLIYVKFDNFLCVYSRLDKII